MPGPFSVAKDAGDFYTYNIHHGFPEGLVRGYRSGFLTDMVRVISVLVCFYVLLPACSATAQPPCFVGRTPRSSKKHSALLSRLRRISPPDQTCSEVG